MYIIADTFQIILRMFLSFQTFLSSSSYKVIECCQFLLPELDVGKEKAKQRKRKEEARRRRKKVLLRNRGAGLRLPKDNTLSLPFNPGLRSSCPSVLSCKRVSCCGQWAPHQGRQPGLGEPWWEACSDSEGMGQARTSLFALGFHWDPLYNDSDQCSLSHEA